MTVKHAGRHGVPVASKKRVMRPRDADRTEHQRHEAIRTAARSAGFER